MSYVAKKPSIGVGSPKCPTCGKTVYFNEQVIALDKAWHQRCLKCAQCSKVLDAGSLNDRDGKIYCKHCYASVAGIKGYGHGALNESHVSGGAAGQAAGAVVLEGADADTPMAAKAASSPNLGAGESAPKFCPQCGTARAANGKFCANCGSSF